MACKLFGLFVFIAVLTSGTSALTQIFLEDEHVSWLTNDHIGKTLGIPKFSFDTLQSCHVVLPSGAMVEAYPNNELNDPRITFLNAAQPFVSCAIGILGAPTSYSGTYELYSVVDDWTGLGLSLTRKKFHLTLREEPSQKPWTIPKFTFDTLQSCHVVLPSGAMVEAYPNNELNDPRITFLNAAQPFVSCAIGILGAPTSYSGTYELYSVVDDWTGLGLRLTRKKFHLTLREGDFWIIPNRDEQ